MPDVNIEFAHIYADSVNAEDFSELEPCIAPTLDLVESLKTRGKSFSLNVLVDNYFPEADTVNERSLVAFLSAHGLRPDGVYMEGDMAPSCEAFIDGLKASALVRRPGEICFSCVDNDPRLLRNSFGSTLKGMFLQGGADIEQREAPANHAPKRVQRIFETVLAQFDGTQTRFSCPLLAACWTLARFGIEPYVDALFATGNDTLRNGFVASSVVTVLPCTYMTVESTVVDLLNGLRKKPLRKLSQSIEYRFFRE